MNLKSEKGSITLFVLASCLFFLASVGCVNLYMQSKQVAVDREYRQIKANYEKDINNMEVIYYDELLKKNSLVNFNDEVINTEQDKITVEVSISMHNFFNSQNRHTLKYGWYSSNENTDTPSIDNISNWTYVEIQNEVINRFIATYNYTNVNEHYYLCVMLDNNIFWKHVEYSQ